MWNIDTLDLRFKVSYDWLIHPKVIKDQFGPQTEIELGTLWVKNATDWAIRETLFDVNGNKVRLCGALGGFFADASSMILKSQRNAMSNFAFPTDMMSL